MKLFQRKTNCISCGGILIVAVVCLAGLDAVFCCGAGAHLGWETHASSCCHPAEHHSPDCGLSLSDALDCTGECGPCKDIPLFRGIHTSDHNGISVAPCGDALPSVTLHTALLSPQGVVPESSPSPILAHLRSTILLI